MTIIEQIKAEIERIRKQDGNPYYPSETADKYYARGVHFTCDNLLSFLSTLESEKPMNQEELEEEIGAYFKDWYVDESDQGYSLKTPTGSAVMGHMKNVARHFAQWGAEHLKQ